MFLTDFLVGEPTDDGLVVVHDIEVLVDFLAEGDLVDVPAEDFLESWVVTKLVYFLSSLQRECS